jgi:hypothetical protein
MCVSLFISVYLFTFVFTYLFLFIYYIGMIGIKSDENAFCCFLIYYFLTMVPWHHPPWECYPKRLCEARPFHPFSPLGKSGNPSEVSVWSLHMSSDCGKKNIYIYIHRKTPYFIGKTIWLFPAVFPLNWSIFSGSTPQTSMVPLAGAWASPGWAWTFAGPFLWAQVGEIMEDKPLVIQHLVGGLEHEFYFSIYWE